VTTFQEFFKWGLDRDIPELISPPQMGHRDPGLNAACTDARCSHRHFILEHLNLGPGNRKIIKNTIGVGRPDEVLTVIRWEAPERLPFEDNSVGSIHAHQFMEHLDSDSAIAVLREMERVLIPGGVVFMTTPYPGHGHFTQALDHKSMWTEETWDWLFNNNYYNGKPWRLEVHACFMAGVVYRNLDLFTQLVKK
jgi:SAM-dependent methyltransferase